MELKINRYTFNVTNKDWVLDNGACIQCMTLKHYSRNASMSSGYKVKTIMSKKQFKELVKNKILVYDEKLTKKLYGYCECCKVYRFNI